MESSDRKDRNNPEHERLCALLELALEQAEKVAEQCCDGNGRCHICEAADGMIFTLQIYADRMRSDLLTFGKDKQELMEMLTRDVDADEPLMAGGER
jgi:hypothetical protein